MDRALVSVDFPDLQKHVTESLQGRSLRMAGAYVFGSALGPCRPESDIDLGVIAADPFSPDWRLQGEVERDLPPFLGHPFDVTVLEANLFTFEVLLEGRPVFVQDQEALLDFVEGVTRRGDEWRWRHLKALREVEEYLAARYGSDR